MRLSMGALGSALICAMVASALALGSGQALVGVAPRAGVRPPLARASLTLNGCPQSLGQLCAQRSSAALLAA